ncbi:hypothetical protein [Niabella aurantiaca]|uniref:hypothetical protein n=1 Tax=Niabella aurantiaca TaxID=379900 RepID=UPI00037B65CA|nr:hypothetical protein [Niabella aurantiaca]
MKYVRSSIAAIGFILCVAACRQPDIPGNKTAGWQEQFRDQLPLLGHRNWIIIADKAYPQQNAYWDADREQQLRKHMSGKEEAASE